MNLVSTDKRTRTLVLIDPTSPDGESGLGLVDANDGAVTLLLLLAEPSAAAIDDYAAAENISVAQAADIYLEQVAARVGDDRHVAAVSTTGVDPVVEILTVIDSHRPRRIVVPPSFPQLRSTAFNRLARVSPIPVVVAAGRAA